MASQAITKMQQARGRLILQHVFWAVLALSLPMVEDPGCGTAWTDHKRIGFDPKFIESLPLDVVLFVIAHEVAHVMFLHALRRGDRDPMLWNIACDHAINILLKKCGFTIWSKACCDMRFAAMSAEQIYEQLKQEAEARGKGKPGDEAGDGKGGTMKNGKYVPAPGEMDGIGGDLKYVPMTPEEVREAERDTKGKVSQAATQAKMCGQLPQEIAQAVGELLSPPQPWYRVFAEYMRQVVYEDESWQRRNRRYSAYFMPGRQNYKMGELVIIGDTSGSMCSPDVYARMSVEIQGVVEQLKPTRTRVIWADDTDCSSQQVFEYGDTIKIAPVGGGGTDMRKSLKYVEQYEPLVVLLITDTYTPWPASVPYPLICASTTDQAMPANLGRTVHLPR
jgi:predicted metal-dependent peptidase